MAENMIKAGRAGLTFGGDWDETVEYNRLVGVRYDNKLFFSKKTVPIGTIPEDGEYWFLAYEGLTDAEWESILNGTQPVGDSNKLGGKDASEYLLKEIKLLPNGTDLNNVTENGKYFCNSYASNYVNAPTNANNGILEVQFYNATRIHQRYYSISQHITYERDYNSNEWSGWNNYLPLSGGNVDGLVKFLYGGNGEMFMFTHTLGGRLRYLKGKDENGNELFGDIVLSENAVKFMTQKDGITSTYNLLHTGNKPSGTYTGNGDATEREIATGGIGNRASVSTGNGMAILSQHGATIVPADGSTPFWSPDYTFANGVITLKGTHKVLNLDGGQYRYQVE